MRKFILVIALSSFVILINGCQTVKVTAQGTGHAIYGVSKSVATGTCVATRVASESVVNGTRNVVKSIVKADNWIKENLW